MAQTAEYMREYRDRNAEYVERNRHQMAAQDQSLVIRLPISADTA